MLKKENYSAYIAFIQFEEADCFEVTLIPSDIDLSKQAAAWLD